MLIMSVSLGWDETHYVYMYQVHAHVLGCSSRFSTLYTSILTTRRCVYTFGGPDSSMGGEDLRWYSSRNWLYWPLQMINNDYWTKLSLVPRPSLPASIYTCIKRTEMLSCLPSEVLPSPIRVPRWTLTFREIIDNSLLIILPADNETNSDSQK